MFLAPSRPGNSSRLNTCSNSSNKVFQPIAWIHRLHNCIYIVTQVTVTVSKINWSTPIFFWVTVYHDARHIEYFSLVPQPHTDFFFPIPTDFLLASTFENFHSAPDSRRIYFSAKISSTRKRIYLSAKISSTGKRIYFSPNISATGKRIYFSPKIS